MTLENIIDKAVESNEVAGINVLVREHGKEVFYHEAGYANLESKKRYTRDAITRMYSMTKPITAAAALILMERGELALGTQLGDILPGFRNVKVWENGELVEPHHWLVVKELLSMTSGLAYGGDNTNPASIAAQKIYDDIDARLESNEEVTTLEMANRLGKGGLSFHPGEDWMYGTSADVLGAVIETVSGMRFSDFLTKEIFEPLGMKDTGFFISSEKSNRLADVYERVDGKLAFCPTRHLGMTYERKNVPSFESGGAGLLSTIDDYALFAQMLLNMGSINGKQILSEKTIDYFTKPRMTNLQQDCLWKNWDSMQGFSYGNLMQCCIEPNMSYCRVREGAYGWDGWLGTLFCNTKENEQTILITCQIKDAGAYTLNERIRNAIFYQF